MSGRSRGPGAHRSSARVSSTRETRQGDCRVAPLISQFGMGSSRSILNSPKSRPDRDHEAVYLLRRTRSGGVGDSSLEAGSSGVGGTRDACAEFGPAGYEHVHAGGGPSRLAIRRQEITFRAGTLNRAGQNFGRSAGRSTGNARKRLLFFLTGIQGLRACADD